MLKLSHFFASKLLICSCKVTINKFPVPMVHELLLNVLWFLPVGISGLVFFSIAFSVGGSPGSGYTDKTDRLASLMAAHLSSLVLYSVLHNGMLCWEGGNFLFLVPIN